MAETRYTFCRICECSCGLKAVVENNRITKITPDKDHVVTNGYACRKGIKYSDFVNSPDRILHPMKRNGAGWEEISWDRALSEIGRKIKKFIKIYGPDSIALNTGSAPAYNFSGSMMMIPSSLL